MAQKGLLTTTDYLPHKEYVRLLECLHRDGNYLWELYCVLAYATGMRASDILSLKWSKLLGKNYLMIVEKKTQKSRMVKINEEVQVKIKQLYALMDSPEKEGFVFKNNISKQPYSIWTVNRQIKYFKFKYKLKIRAFSTHSFRKTFGRHVYEMSENKSEALIRLQRALNHTDPQTTMRYIGLVQDDIDKIYDAISLNA